MEIEMYDKIMDTLVKVGCVAFAALIITTIVKATILLIF